MTRMNKILLLDSDTEFRETIARKLNTTMEFILCEASNAAQALNMIRRNVFALVIMDMKLSDTDGYVFCQMLRRQKVHSSLMILTNHDSDADIIKCLNAGADSHVSKSIGFSVLLARIRAILRQHEKSENIEFMLGSNTFIAASRKVITKDGDEIPLTQKEADILKLLYRSNRVVGQNELLSEIWGYNSKVETHTLETHVYRLRQKIEAIPAEPRILITKSNGYFLSREL